MDLINFVDKVFEKLIPYIPLMQAIVWPLTLLALLVLCRKQLKWILGILIDRLESGSAFEAGPFKLGAKLASPSPEEREKKLEADLSPAIGISLQETEKHIELKRPNQTVVSPDTYLRKQEMARFYRIEDAALSRISEKIGIPITREVKPNRRSSLVFDGVALDPKGFRIVEVKILRNLRNVNPTVRRFLDSISSFYLTIEESNRNFVSVILVAVIGRDFQGDSSSISRNIAAALGDYSFPIQVEQFTERELIDDDDVQPDA